MNTYTPPPANDFRPHPAPVKKKKYTFLKMFLASVLGFFTSFFIMGLLATFFIVAITASVMSSVSNPKTAPVRANSVLRIDINALPEVNMGDLTFSSPKEDIPVNLSLSEALAAIERAESDKSIKGIYINTSDPGGGFAAAEALRDAIEHFRKSGKFVVSYADNYTQKGYYVASVADKVYLNPQGMLSFDGLSQSVMYYKEALDKLGVEMMVFKVGTYKSAVEPYLLNEMSEANREQITSYLGSIWSNMLQKVSASRNIPADSLQALADLMPTMMDPSEYKSHRLVDALLYENQVKQQLCSMMEVKDPDELNIVNLYDYQVSLSPKKVSGREGTVGVIFAEGNIVDMVSGGFATQSYISGSLADEITQMARDESVDAMVLRINSPGGSAFTSEQIWYAVHEAAALKPVVVSMGDYAASGGYYISSGAPTIIAQPNTVTGSIGIFGMFPNSTKLMDKLGVNVESVSTARFADFGSLGRPMSQEEKDLMQGYVNRGYKTFLTRVADARGKTIEQVDSIAQGRVWTGSQALELGLVDKLGGLNTAINEAATQANLKAYDIRYEGNTVSLLDQIFGTGMTTVRAAVTGIFLTQEEQKLLEQARYVRSLQGLQARMPFMVLP